MREYSPKRRTALIFTGSGTSGAFHAGALKALDESGVKIDLVVGSGVGVVAAAFSAVAGGAKLYGPGGFWDGLRWSSLYALRPVLRVALTLLAMAFGAFLLPVLLGLLGGVLGPFALAAELAAPGTLSRALEVVWPSLISLGAPYLVALALPIFALSLLVLGFAAVTLLRYRRRFPEALEAVLDARPGERRLARGLWEVARGAALSAAPPDERELGKRYVGLLAENLSEPGFRELILRTTDLESGTVLPFVVLQDAYRSLFGALRARGPRSRLDGLPGAVDLKAPACGELFFDAVATGIAAPLASAVRRVAFPRGGLHAGETRRLAEAALAGGSGLAEALAAGAEQAILVSATPETAAPRRRRGPLAMLDAAMGTLERQALERDVAGAERINRIVETLGHRTEDGGRAWQDPATGRVYRDFALYVVRPTHRGLGPLELDGARDPATDVLETPADLLELGYRETYRLFVEPVVGAVPDSEARRERQEERQPVEL
jgi:hypothetical protein